MTKEEKENLIKILKKEGLSDKDIQLEIENEENAIRSEAELNKD